MKRILWSALAVLLAASCSSDIQNGRAGTSQETPVPPAGKRPVFDHAAGSVAVGGFNANANVQKFIAHEAAGGRFSAGELQSFFNNVEYKGNIINIMNRPGTSRPWYEFRAANAGAARIAGGRRFYTQHRETIDAAAKGYGVPAEIIVAIIGIETNYGTNMGSFRLADSLSTLAFDYPRRAEFFQQELHELLLMAREEKRDVFGFKGSYAGAMGMPQFMPSSFRKYAVDYDGDGRRDIWNNIGDVAASVANYLKAHGWQSGGKMVVPATLTITQELQNIIDEKTAPTRTVGDLKRLGVMPQQVVDDNEKAILYRLETAPGVYEYYIGLNNFYTVWQYNHSRMYVTAVRDIANGVSGNYRL
ncbi:MULTISPECIES: lytic murein transglycosylase B [Neisseria]|uniref:Lytic murein transglycosylase B n=1 Tax=Neisseria musculi TaxID=1815583 RepID=A0A7H1M9E0_9NEIS|nr:MULTISPECIES: lytic murein transglycosylase B [Neisseria]MBF0804712.1 lytic murein transglycosylase B [Neisseria sp. 19428wB4_WF04]QNT58255.1 lytic murein transglycosylase B [Neisseria musculi]TFU40262.1 lytic murein transglycosylase B [Neisseria sp. WF04]